MARINDLKKAIVESIKHLNIEFGKNIPSLDLGIIKEKFYLFSWRMNEINWEYKNKIKGLVTDEQICHLFDYICRYLVKNTDVDVNNWKNIASEFKLLAGIFENEKALSFSSLREIVRPAYAESRLQMIQQKLEVFFKKSPDPASGIDWGDLLKLLVTIGKDAGKLAGIDPELPDDLKATLDLIKDINSLGIDEKKLTKFEPPELVEKVWVQIQLMDQNIKKYFDPSVQSIDPLQSEVFRNLHKSLKKFSNKSAKKTKYPESNEKNSEDFARYIIGHTEALKDEFQKDMPNYEFIKEKFISFSLKLNEINEKFKDKLTKAEFVSEESWDLLDFISCYLSGKQMDVNDLSCWKDIVTECKALAKIIEIESEIGSEFKCLKERIQNAYATSQLEILKKQMKNFFESSTSFNPEQSIDCYALLGLLMVVGEGAKRLEGIRPKLSGCVTEELKSVKEIRNSLEKKLPANLFESPELMRQVYKRLEFLKDCIDKYPQNALEFVTSSESKPFIELLNLLKEESEYKYPEQAEIFFTSLKGRQEKLFEKLKTRNFESKNGFKISHEDFEKATEKQILTNDEKNDLVNLVNTHSKDEDKKKIRILEKKIRQKKTKAKDIKELLSVKNMEYLLDICGIKKIINQISARNSEFLSELSAKSNLEQEKILKLEDLFDAMGKKACAEIDKDMLFTRIKNSPWLLDLSDVQCKFLKVLNQDETIDGQNALDNLLKSNEIEGNQIPEILGKSNLLYKPRPYYEKFSYEKKESTVSNEILRIVDMIDKLLIKLLVEIKQMEQFKDSQSTSENLFSELIIKNYTYQFALQTAIKSFSTILKYKLGKEAKNQLLANNTDDLSVKHIKLLELFRNELAHRAAEVDPDQIAWFALQWAIISYPEIKRRAAMVPTLSTFDSQENERRNEGTNEEDALTKYAKNAFLIKGLAREHGFKEVQVFGFSLGCETGIQTEFNLIVEPVQQQKTTALDLYDLQWKIHFLLAWDIKVFTEESLKICLKATASQYHIAQILQHGIELVNLYHREKMRDFIRSGYCHGIKLANQPEIIRRFNSKDMESKLDQVETIVLDSRSKDLSYDCSREKQYRIGLLLENDQVKETIRKKAETYTNHLLEMKDHMNSLLKINPTEYFETKAIILERLQTTMQLNDELDQFYENNVKEIQQFDLGISRLQFRSIMRKNNENLPNNIKNSDLAKRAQKDWNEEPDKIMEISRKHLNYDGNIIFLLGILRFLLDEVRDTRISTVLFNDDQYQELINYVCNDFSKRFIDVYEDVSRIEFYDYILRQQRVYFRKPLFDEILSSLPRDSLPTQILNQTINLEVRQKLLHITQKEKLLPNNMEMTIDTLYQVCTNWRYDGKIQYLSCKAVDFEYPSITDFDELLLTKNKVNKESYPDYEKDKRLFNQFQEIRSFMNEIYDCEKRISKLQKDLEKRENNALNIPSDDEVYEINQLVIEEIYSKLMLLQGLQRSNIKKMMDCQYIKLHPDFDKNRSVFKEKLSEELSNWVWCTEDCNSDKKRFYNFISSCFNSNTSSVTLFGHHNPVRQSYESHATSDTNIETLKI